MRVLNGDDSGFRDNFYWKFTLKEVARRDSCYAMHVPFAPDNHAQKQFPPLLNGAGLIFKKTNRR